MSQGSASVKERITAKKKRVRSTSVPSAAPVHAATGSQKRQLPLPRFLPGVIAGAIMWLCFFPMSWGWLGWVTLVPLFCLVRVRDYEGSGYRFFRSPLFGAWIGGLLFFWVALNWMRVADYRMYYTWALLATYSSVYFVLAVWFLRKLEHKTRLPLLLTGPLVWVGLEFVRANVLSGFHWYFLGYTQHDYLPLIQIADIGGVFLVSVLIVIGNVWLFELLFTQAWFRDFFQLRVKVNTPVRIWWHTGVFAFALMAAIVYGNVRLEETEFEPGPRVSLMQSNLDQRIKNQAYDSKETDTLTHIRKHYDGLCKIARAAAPDLIVWPETSFPLNWMEERGVKKLPIKWQNTASIQQIFRGYAIEYEADMLFGVNREILTKDLKEIRYNSALMVRKDGHWHNEGVYDKIHRLPFGEYLPFVEWLPFMQRFAPYDSPYSIREGENFTRFKLGKYRFGVLICYEDTVHYLARQYSIAQGGQPPVDFLVNMSNEGWFLGTAEHEEHLATSRFRAIESRRAMVRAANMGISGLIDSNGRILKPRGDPNLKNHWVIPTMYNEEELSVSEWSRFKKMAGVFTVSVPIDRRTSLYSQWGDWLGWSCAAFLLFGLVWCRFPGVKK